MNVFNHYRQAIGDIVGGLSANGDLPPDLVLDRISVEPPRDPSHGDIASNAAMVLAKPAKMKPRDIAEALADRLSTQEGIAGAEVAGPGFLNLRLDEGVWAQVLAAVIAHGERYGAVDIGNGEKVNVEYVSANPTGPLHVGHGRGAAYGSVVADLDDEERQLLDEWSRLRATDTD